MSLRPSGDAGPPYILGKQDFSEALRAFMREKQRRHQ